MMRTRTKSLGSGSWVSTHVRKVRCLLVRCNNRGNQIRDSGRQFYDRKCKKHFDNLFSSVGDWFKAMGENPTNRRFGEDWAKLTKDFLFDSEGSLKFKPDLCNDMRKIIVPTLVDKVCIALLFARCVSC
jgi:hypothetical protein